MKPKLILLTLMILLYCTGVKPQEIVECATTIPPEVTVQQAQSGNLNLYKRTTFTEPLRLAVHIVRYSDGSGGISQSDLEQKIIDLNLFMAQAQFKFYVYRIDYINSDNYANINNINKADQLRLINVIENCINIYFVPLAYFNGISSFSSRIQDPILWSEQGIIIRNDAPPTTLPHEMGHYFDLFHTPEVYFGFENIARTGGCANWVNTGDLLEDTPADPSYRVQAPTIDLTNCQWINPPIKPLPPDGCGQTNYNPLTNNMMHTQVAQCRTTFTQDQKDRMNETLMLYRSELLKPLVYLENSANSSNAGGTLHIGSNNYNSGKYVLVDEGTYNIGTNNERFTNFQGSGFTYKHNNWNELSDDFFLSRNIEIITDNDQIGKFYKLERGKIQVLLEGNIVTGAGTGSFQDPWYVLANANQPGNYWINFTSEYEPNGKEGATEKGVFLNQPYTGNNPVYYSVKTDYEQNIFLNQTGRTHKFYFQGWSASPEGSAEFQNANLTETPVVFKQANATVQANLKGTQLSNDPSAYNTTSQRKYVKTNDGYLHSVYESMGKVWYEVSSDNGVSWVLQNNGNPISASGKQPAIDYHYYYDSYTGDTYHQIVIVW